VSSGAFAARKSVFDEYLGLAGLADKVARALGVGSEIIGRVALDYDDPARVEVLIPPEWWVEKLARAPEVLDPGYYLLAVDPKTLSAVLLVVENARPRPVVRAGPQSHVDLSTHEPAAGEAVVPILIEASMASAKHLAPHLPEGKENPDPKDVLAAFKSAPPRAAGAPPDPNSPVVIPPAEVVTDMLFLREEDYYVLGALGVLDSPYRPLGGSLVEFPLPWSVARKHILVTGTTGSGKTSLVKNLLANVVHRHETLAAKDPLNVLVLDASGDFRVTVLPGSPGRSETLTLYALPGCKRLLNAVIALPLAPRTTVNYKEVIDYAREYASFLVEDEARLLAGRPKCRVRRVDELPRPCPALLVEAECSTPDGPAKPRFVVAPFAMKAERGRLLMLLASIDPYLTERAKEIIKTLEDVEKSHCQRPVGQAIEEIAKGISGALTSRGQKGSSCNNLGSDCAREICSKAKGMHPGSLGNLLSRLKIWGAVGLIVDRFAAVCPAEYAMIAGHSQWLGEAAPSVVIVDLEYPARVLESKADMDQLKVSLGYNMLRSFVGAVGSVEGGRAFLVVDEAHLFFPSNSERSEWASVLVRELKWVARLGRSRGISLVFSTHRPSDVDRVVFTLANTKVYMRTDVKTARDAELPQGLKERLPFFKDHAGIVEGYYVRGGYATFVGGPSMLGHRLV